MPHQAAHVNRGDIMKHPLRKTRGPARLLAAAACAALAAMAVTQTAHAQSFPNKPVRIVVPFAAGSALDITARMLGEELRLAFNQPFIVENRVGAAGRIGTEQVMKAPADGYTLLLGSNTSHSANPFLFKQVGYDPIKDFTPIAGILTLPVVVVVHPKTPVNSVQELINWGRSRAGKFSFGYGNSIAQVTGVAIAKAGGIDVIATPYKGSPQVMSDLMGEQLDFGVTDTASAKSILAAGRLKALAVSSGTRSAVMPDVPTIGETPALAGFEVVSWMGLFGPAGVPADIVNRLSSESRNALGKPAVRERIAGFAADATPLSPEQLGAFVATQLSQWGKRIKDAGIQPE